MPFKKLLEIVGDNAEAKAEISKLQANYTQLTNEVQGFESKINDLKQSRDKYKEKLALFKKSLKIEEGEELNEDTISKKLGNVKGEVKQEASEIEKALKAEIAELEKTIENLKNEYEEKIGETKKTLLDKEIDIQLFKNTAGINAVNAKAQNIIISELKKGLEFDENGNLVYKTKEGTTLRKDGVPMTLVQKLEEIKNSEDFSFLFKSEAQSGSGLKTGRNTGTGKTTSRLRQRALERGIALNV